jgi:hypothetical protein
VPRGHKRELLHAIGSSMPLPEIRFIGSIRDVI